MSEWEIALIGILGGFLVLMFSGFPIAFCFMMINIIGVIVFWGGEAGIVQLVRSMRDSISSFTLVTLPLFILMGNVMFLSRVATRMMDTLDKWIGRMPGRLGLLAVGGGTIFGTLSGSGMASCAMLGSTLVPEMERRSYNKTFSIGAILASAGLDVMIPPSNLGIIAASIGQWSVGKFLVAIIVPGLLLAVVFAAYIIIRSVLNPKLAPIYDVPGTSLRQKLSQTARYILPLGLIFVLVMGLIFMGVATPTESAALGAIGAFVLAVCYRGLTWNLTKKAFANTISVTAMVLLILTGASAFSQILAFSGASQGVVDVFINLPVPPFVVIIMMMVVVFVMGTAMEEVSVMLVTLPIFVPVVQALGYDLVWFGTIYLLNIVIACISPPFGLTLFVMKGVSPKGTTMGDIYRAVLPYIVLQLGVMALMLAFPVISMGLPSLMRVGG